MEKKTPKYETRIHHMVVGYRTWLKCGELGNNNNCTSIKVYSENKRMVIIVVTTLEVVARYDEGWLANEWRKNNGRLGMGTT